jgi:hypothetical protein
MRQRPVYVLNQSQHNFRQGTTQADLDEIEDWTDRAARRMYEGAGLGPNDVDIFNPYDGYAIMTQFYLEAFQWHGVKRGDPFAFYAGDIRVEGPHPFSSSGGNLGTGRTRTSMYTTASNSSAARLANGRSRFGQRLRWQHSPRPAAAAGSCSANPRVDGLCRYWALWLELEVFAYTGN